MTDDISGSLFDTLDSLNELADEMKKYSEFVENPQINPDAPEDHEIALHICDRCAFQSEDLEDFMDHVLYEPHFLTCIKCAAKLAKPWHLKKHYRNEHGSVQYIKCDDCKYKAESKELLHSHKFSVHISNVYTCISCNQYYSFSNKFSEHIKSHQDPTKVKTGQKILKRKIALEEKRKPEQSHCDQCTFVTNTEKNLSLHTMKYHDKSFKSDECEFSSKKSTDFKSHGDQMHNGIVHACDQCMYTTPLKRSLAQHIFKEHSCEGERFACNICHIEVQTNTSLKRHKRIQHEMVPNIHCEYCDYKAKTKSRIKEHIDNVHMKIRHECGECDYNSYRQYRITVHKRMSHSK